MSEEWWVFLHSLTSSFYSENSILLISQSVSTNLFTLPWIYECPLTVPPLVSLSHCRSVVRHSLLPPLTTCIPRSPPTALSATISISRCNVTFSVLVICWVKSNSSQCLLNVFPIISQALPIINIYPTNHQLFTKILSTHPPPPNIYSIYSQVSIGQSLTKLWCWLILWRDVW